MYRTGMYLSEWERQSIWMMLKRGDKPATIARTLHRSRSTIHYELKRGKVLQWLPKKYDYGYVYDPDYAQTITKRNCERKGAGIKIAKDHETANALSSLIKQGYSPYAALIVAKEEGLLKTAISLSTLYRYIKNGYLDVTPEDLPYGPRRKNLKDIPFQDRIIDSRTPVFMSIVNRPREILSRKEFGHWEGDTVVSGKDCNDAVMTLVERKTRYGISYPIKTTSAEEIQNALNKVELLFGDLFNLIFKTITFDNGTEFRNYKALQLSIHKSNRTRDGTGGRLEKIYYAHPYCSCERGTNEVFHRFIRRKWPKGYNFCDLNIKEYEEYIDWVNDYPRAILGGLSARKCFLLEISKLAA